MTRLGIRSAAVAAAASFFAAASAAAQASHAHIGHVADGWNDTPDQAGLLPTAMAEAEVAVRHAQLATQAGAIAGIKTHTGHVLHAIDPTLQENGPGKGYGVVKATTGAARHTQLAADAEGASDNVKLHANHMTTSLGNVTSWVEELVEVCNQISATDDAAEAERLAGEMAALTDAIVNGRDANGDGRVSWEEGEGGLTQAAFHLNLMKQGEGLN